MAASEPPVQVDREATSGALTGVRLVRAALSWVRRKPLGAAGAVIVLGMLLVAPAGTGARPLRSRPQRLRPHACTAQHGPLVWYGSVWPRCPVEAGPWGSHRHDRGAGRFVDRGLSGVDVGRDQCVFRRPFRPPFSAPDGHLHGFPADHHGARHRVNLWHRHPQCRRGDHGALYSTLCSGGTFPALSPCANCPTLMPPGRAVSATPASSCAI